MEETAKYLDCTVDQLQQAMEELGISLDDDLTEDDIDVIHAHLHSGSALVASEPTQKPVKRQVKEIKPQSTQTIEDPVAAHLGDIKAGFEQFTFDTLNRMECAKISGIDSGVAKFEEVTPKAADHFRQVIGGYLEETTQFIESVSS